MSYEKDKHKYRSGFEKKVHEHVLPHTDYEPWRLDYTPKPKQYICDFVDEERLIIWEIKGFFRERQEASKYFPIIEAAKVKGYRFIFLFQHPNNAMPGVRRRKKCGTKQTMAEWAEKHNIEWYGYRNVPVELR